MGQQVPFIRTVGAQSEDLPPLDFNFAISLRSMGELTKFESIEESYMSQPISPEDYEKFVSEIRATIQKAQLEAYRKLNKTIIDLYWYIGQKITEKQKKYQWGKAVVENLSMDLQKDFPGIRGFSVQNLWAVAHR